MMSSDEVNEIFKLIITSMILGCILLGIFLGVLMVMYYR